MSKTFSALAVALVSISSPSAQDSGPLGGNGVVVPATSRSALGSDNAIPFSWTPTRYQQVFAGSEFPASKVTRCVAFRSRRASTGATVDVEIWMGYTKHDWSTLTTTFANNTNSGPLVQVLKSKMLRVPSMPANTDPRYFFFQIPFDTSFAWTRRTGRNLLTEIRIHGNSNQNRSFNHVLNGAVTSTTSRVFSMSGGVTAPTGIENTGLRARHVLRHAVPGYRDGGAEVSRPLSSSR